MTLTLLVTYLKSAELKRVPPGAGPMKRLRQPWSKELSTAVAEMLCPVAHLLINAMRRARTETAYAAQRGGSTALRYQILNRQTTAHAQRGSDLKVESLFIT